ncbi:Ulp1 protease family, carboxy-terminal domain protein [Arachis hypogaea]|nr:Ulp1 protease family, carboxy-terminal domain protein [Arachis hypogaea]
MSSQGEDGDSKHTLATSKGGGGSSYISRRRATSNTIRKSPSRLGFSEPAVSVRPWSPTQSGSRSSCARRKTPAHSNSVPPRTDVQPTQSLTGTGSSCARVANDRQQQSPRKSGVRCPCWNGIPAKRQLGPDDLLQDALTSQDTYPSQDLDPTYAPTMDANFIMDHMPFRSKRSKRASRNRRSARTKTQPNIPHNLVDLTVERRAQARRPRPPCSKSPRRSNCLQNHYNNLAPVGSNGIVDESALLCIKTEKIPKAFNLAFVPTRSMDLAGVELPVATYIFSKDLPKSEILADVGHCVADRTALLTLGPNERVMDDVITIVATMLSKTSSQHQWFMPTMIMGPISLGHQQDALQGTRMTQANMDAVVSKHMRCKVDKVTEIFQPMWTDGHWYLMVVDVRRQRLIYFDSFKCPTETESRKLAMTQVKCTLADFINTMASGGATITGSPWFDPCRNTRNDYFTSAGCVYWALHLESLTIGPKWLSKTTAERPRFSSFPFEEPVVPQQHHLSMDCGVWVLQWMIRGALWAIHSVTAVNSQTRMRIAVDLVLRSHNAKAIDVVEKAMTFWKKKLESSQRGHKR